MLSEAEILSLSKFATFQNMAQDVCRYSCMGAVSTEPLSFPDISGTGVMLGYTIAAGVAVSIVIVHYTIAFSPELDPFRPARDSTQESKCGFEPNPIDNKILGPMRKLFNRSSTIPHDTSLLPSRDRAVLMKCIMILSDLQLLTGISLLVSGFTQLRCGISAYHWRKLVHIAWFASITHLACLTSLRPYLYQHKGKRLWREIAMSALIIMLIVALVPTGHFAFVEPVKDEPILRPTPPDAALCYFTQAIWSFPNGSLPTAPLQIPDGGKVSRNQGDMTMNRKYMLISVSLLALGLFFRLIRLHQRTNSAFVKLRKLGGKVSVHGLNMLYSRVDNRSLTSKILRPLIYHPVLALYIFFKVLLDFAASMAFELVISFTWGVLRLWAVQDLPNPWTEPNAHQWTFGQVLPLISLAAPIISILESYSSGRPEIKRQHQSRQNHATAASTAPPFVAGLVTHPATDTVSCHLVDHRGRNFYQAPWMRMCLLCSALAVICSSSSVLASVVRLRGPELVFTFASSVWSSLPFNISAGLFFTVLFSLLFENFHKCSRPIAWAVNVVRLLVFSSIFLVHISLATILPALSGRSRLWSYSKIVPLCRGNFLGLVFCYLSLSCLGETGLVKKKGCRRDYDANDI